MILVINNKTVLLDEIEEKLKGLPHEVKDASEGITPADYDLIIISGGREHPVVDHEDFYRNELNLIRSAAPAGPKILGICLGFELIAYAFGSSLELIEPKESQNVEIKIVRDDAIFANIDTMNVFESHRWRVKTLGKGLIPLATSHYGIEAFRHASLPLYGFQFHPEMAVDERNDNILWKNILSIVPRVGIGPTSKP